MAVHWSGPQPPCWNRWRSHEWRSKRTLISCLQKKKSESYKKSVRTRGNPCWSVQSRWRNHNAEIGRAIPVYVEWREGKVPRQLKDADIVHIYKRKGKRQSCHNNHWIFLSYSLLARSWLASRLTASSNILSRVSSGGRGGGSSNILSRVSSGGGGHWDPGTLNLYQS